MLAQTIDDRVRGSEKIFRSSMWLRIVLFEEPPHPRTRRLTRRRSVTHKASESQIDLGSARSKARCDPSATDRDSSAARQREAALETREALVRWRRAVSRPLRENLACDPTSVRYPASGRVSRRKFSNLVILVVSSHRGYFGAQ